MLQKIKNLLKKLWHALTDPTIALEKEYGRLLLEARDLQRKGDIPAFAKKVKEADDVRNKIEELKEQK